VRETQRQLPLPGVPKAKQGREVPQRWAWTEASVWTERMVATLERGIKGGKWFSLVDKVWKMENLQSAAAKVQANGGAAGVDGLSCEDYLKDSALRLRRLQAELQQDSYRPHPVKRVWIPKLGSKELRPLGVPTVEDRVVETALRNVIEPIFENMFAEHSYGFRPGRGAKDALRRVDQLLKAGKVWVVDADLKAYLDPYSYYTLAVEGSSKSCGWLSKTRMRRPFCLPRLTWTTATSPRFTRCMTVWRDTPSKRMA
jgi:RNA-directed DNA polymerase